MIAGALRLGDRSGPAFYTKSFHAAISILAHENAHNEKPREPLDSWMYNRPLFYSCPRRLKCEKAREDYIEMARRNQSRRVSQLLEMNQSANAEVSRGGRNARAEGEVSKVKLVRR